ncbi:MAG: MBL fold metallo-hydrolase [Lachnospiraceae bacterium]|nr:MBL fold metallo-hydrolase [Lachnospiraceae bacterium]
MKLMFIGAAHEVTGSCYYLEAAGKKLLIDCGMEQGKDLFLNRPIPVNAADIDYVLLTHAHIDHSGKLPLLVKEGFKGQIVSTEGTRLLCSIMLQDSAHIQESEAEWKNRKAERAGREKTEPLYTVQDAQDTMKLFAGYEYGREIQLAGGIRIRFTDAGHLLGSASIEIWLSEEGVEKKLLFSGDIGNSEQPLLEDPTFPSNADYVIMESTYGDRSHEKCGEYTLTLAAVLQETFDRGGNVVIPSFAVGRTQEILYFIRQIKEQKLVRGHDDFEVFVDSPLSVLATQVFMKRMFKDFDEEAKEVLDQGLNPIGFPGLRTAVTSADSIQINSNPNCKVIISSSGMCEAGRIRHHLKHNLWRSDSAIVFVGYQAEGTLGRKLLEGAKKVMLFGEEITVRAKVLQLPGISGHADNEGLLSWIASMTDKPSRVFVTHGDDQVCQIFRDRLIHELGLEACAPYSGSVFDLAADRFELEAAGMPVTEGMTPAKGADRGFGIPGNSRDVQSCQPGELPVSTAVSKGQARHEQLVSQLLGSVDRLRAIAKGSQDGANADLERLTKEIQALCEKWEK